MDEEGLQALRRRKGRLQKAISLKLTSFFLVDISGTTTQVFEYKWDTNGDPSESRRVLSPACDEDSTIFRTMDCMATQPVVDTTKQLP